MQASIPLGTVVGGRWQVTGVLGQGGFGQVLLAVDTSPVGLGEAALKVLHPNTTPAERFAFHSEVKKIAALRHPNLVGYLDSGQITMAASPGFGPGGEGDEEEIRPYLVTELCAFSLADQLKRAATGRLSLDDTLSVLADVCTGLDHLHAQGLIHRDIKPGNVLFADNRWKLADFGLMRDLSLTGSYHRGGALMGTPLFMAPELFADLMATPASDIYAMGVLAHVCLTGRYLHSGAGPVLIHNIASQPPTVEPTLPPTLRHLILRCAEADPRHRPDSHELVELVRALRSGPVEAPAPAPAWPPPGAPGAPHQTTVDPAPAWSAAAHAAPASAPTTNPEPAAPYGQAWPPAGPQPAGPQPWPTPGPGPAATGGPWATAPGSPGSYPTPGTGAGAKAGRPRTGVLLAGAFSGLAIVVVLGLVAWALSSAVSASQRAQQLARDAADGATTTSFDRGGPTTTGLSTGGNVSIGGGLTIGGNVKIGRSGASPQPLPNPESHLTAPLCQGGKPPALVEVVNSYSGPVDYTLHLYHLDATGVRVGESYGSLHGLGPGQHGLLSADPSEDAAATCTIDSFTVTPDDPGNTVDPANAKVTKCTLDTFFGNFWDYSYTVTNPSQQTVDASITISVVDAKGVVLGQFFEETVSNMAPGQTVSDTGSGFVNTIKKTDKGAKQCVVSLVQLEAD